jgi:Domain of unknown function (DUF4395)
MVKICPVSVKRTNENINRLNAAFSVIWIASFFLTMHPVFIYIIFSDFILRNIMGGKLNPVIWLNTKLFEYFSLPVSLINAGPKIFAARIGLILSLTGVLLFLLISIQAALIPLIILGFFSFMEAAFNFCMACKIYPYMLSLNDLLNKKEINLSN